MCRCYDPELGRFLNADALVSTGQGLLGNNMFAYCGNNPISRADFAGHAFVQMTYDDGNHLNLLCPALGGGGGGCSYAMAGFSLVKDKIDKYDPSYTESVGVTMGTSSYGHTTGGTGSLAYDSSGDLALQLTQTIGESTCLSPGVSIGLCRTYSTANMEYHSISRGLKPPLAENMR